MWNVPYKICPPFSFKSWNSVMKNFIFKLQDYKYFVRLNFSTTTLVQELPLCPFLFLYICLLSGYFLPFEIILSLLRGSLFGLQALHVNRPQTCTTLHSVIFQAYDVCFNWCFFQSVCDISFPPLPVTLHIIHSFFICTHTSTYTQFACH